MYITLCGDILLQLGYIKAYCEGEGDEGGGRKINRNCPISNSEAKILI